MSFAKNGCAKALQQLLIKDNMQDNEVVEQLNLFWNRVYDSVSSDLGENTFEKNIYHILLAQQIMLPTLEQWKQVEDFPAPKPVKESKFPKIRKVLLILAIIVMLANILFALIGKQNVAAIIGLVALVFVVLAFFSLLTKKRKTIEPPKMTPICHWNIVAIEKYLSDKAIAIDADAAALIPHSNNKLEALDLVEVLLLQIYQGDIPNGGEIHGKVKSYLMLHDIQLVDYSANTAGMFTLLPSNGEKALLPALVKDGQVLSMGKACIEIK